MELIIIPDFDKPDNAFILDIVNTDLYYTFEIIVPNIQCIFSIQS